ncbi:MAG TPA: Rho termination factor N-terminal domain-containing protein [Solirubrobacteraceae bacterium]|nr:Rho termination factor N-terminal domain-containing protein [Solirubrobacteraceae bacterium]
MSAVLDRSALEQSPLADLHVIANELGVDGFRRLRKADLIDRILAGQPVGDETADESAAEEATAEAIAVADAADEEGDGAPRSRRGRRGGRGRARARSEEGAADEEGTTDEDADEPKARGRDGGRESGRDKGGKDKDVEGVIELLANGSGFVRLAPPEPTDDDVYVSAAQVKRCELVSGDRVTGPVRAPRRSERFPSLVRVDTINGRPADEVAEGTRFEDLPVAFPSQRLELGSDDATVKAIEWLTPIGKGSRVVLAGGARAGKTEALRRLAAALGGQDALELTLVLAGVRPEETAEWEGIEPVAAVSFAASPDAQAQAIEQAVEQGRRVAARGGDAVVLIDTLDYVPAGTARRALAAARDLVDGGSLTIIATAASPLGGETTVVALDPLQTALGQFPAIDLTASGTLRPERLVGDAGAEAIAKTRAEQLGQG